MRSTEAARAAGRLERARIGQGQTREELRDRLIGRLADLGIDVIAVSSAQMEGSRANIDGESGVVKYDETLSLDEVVKELAHEMGHVVLHGRVTDRSAPLDPVLSSAYADSGPAAIARYSPQVREEVEANAFALEFVCPSDEVFSMWQVERQLTIEALASLFGVSGQVIRVQLANALHDVAVGRVGARVPKGDPVMLTEDQLRAASCTGRPVLVDAGAGTGKTATLIGRVEFLLRERKARPEQILVVTFSNEAAQELSDRVGDRFGAEIAKAITVSTFHGLGMEFLHFHGNAIGYDESPTLIDEDAQAELIYEILGRVSCSDPALLRDPWEVAVRFVEHINHCKHALITPDVLSNAVQSDPTVGKAGAELVEVYREYERAKYAAGLVDFADLIMLPLRILDTMISVRDAWRTRYPWVMVDEFQDVSRATSRLLRALCGPTNPPWVVGDARQAIYRFLGASPENVSNFRAEFPDAELFSLEVNYRSSEPVVAVANNLADLMAASSTGKVHAWRRGANIDPLGPEPVVLAEAISDYAESAGVVEQVRAWIERDGVLPGDIAVLARRHVDVRSTMLGLKGAGIKAQAAGLLTAEGAAGDLAAALVIADATQAAFPRLGYALGRGFHSPQIINELARQMFAADAAGGPLFDQIGAVQAKAEDEKFSGDGWVALTSFLFESSHYLRRVLDAADTAERAVTLIEIVSTLSLAAAYRATHPDLVPREARIGFAERLRIRLTETVPLPLMPKPRSDAVRVMTCHAAKGLEFGCVVVAGQTVPRMPPKYPWLPTALRPASSEDDAQADSLLFVGVTRAKRAVVVSWPTHAGQGPNARDKKVVPLLDSWRHQATLPVRAWNAYGSDAVTAVGRPVWGFPERGTLKASALGAVCPLLTYLENILGMRFPEEDLALYPRFFAAVRRALRQIVILANQTGRRVTESEVAGILDVEWPSDRFSDHPHFDLYRSEAQRIAQGFASAFAPGAVGSVMLEPELDVIGGTRGPKLLLDLVAYFREPTGRVVAIAFRPESYAAKAKNGALAWSTLATKRTSFVLAEANVGATTAVLYSGADRATYAYSLQSRNRKEDSVGKEAAELAGRYRALATGDFTTPVNSFRCDRCRARVSCPHWLGALDA